MTEKMREIENMNIVSESVELGFSQSSEEFDLDTKRTKPAFMMQVNSEKRFEETFTGFESTVIKEII
jgi:hypothetical protein